MKNSKKYVIRHKERKNYYARTLFIHQRHFVADIKDAKKFSYKEAKDFLKKFKNINDYEIKEVKI